MFEALDQLLDSFISMGVPGNDCAVYHKGVCVYRKQRGFSDLENKIQMKGNERFNIYSCSKPITCVAAMQLYEKGKFMLDDPLSEYLPEFKNMTVLGENGKITEAKNQIKVGNLFDMTAGFTYDFDSDAFSEAARISDGRCPTRLALGCFAKKPLSFEPGSRWQYSFSHDVLALLVEVISGERFADYVKKNIFDPLGMTSSTFALPEDELDTLAAQYVWEGGSLKRVSKNIQHYKFGSMYDSGGAGCISTVDDYMKFLEALRIGDSILKKQTIDLMATSRLADSQYPDVKTWLRSYGYGLGMRCGRDGCDYSDFGWNGAAGAHMAVDRENDITVFYVQHVLASPIARIRHLVYPTARDDLKSR